MQFEFDQAKSVANEEKHGIDFIAAQALWADELLLEVHARTDDEERFIVIGQIDGTFWSAIVTYRAGRVRLISVRRSRDEEIALYEG